MPPGAETATGARARQLLRERIWPLVPAAEIGRRLSAEEEDEILGYGAEAAMIVDSPAIVAVVFREPDCDELVGKLSQSSFAGMSTPTLVETGIVLGRRLEADPLGSLSELLEAFDIITVSFGDHHWREAVRAYQWFGRGRDPARLNFGDCISYATARLADEPLLFAGEDFRRTDIAAA